jgi:hypothetical protein
MFAEIARCHLPLTFVGNEKGEELVAGVRLTTGLYGNVDNVKRFKVESTHGRGDSALTKPFVVPFRFDSKKDENFSICSSRNESKFTLSREQTLQLIVACTRNRSKHAVTSS